MAHHTPLALGQILPHILGLITHLDILRPVTPQRFQALTVHLATAQPQSLVGCIPSPTARLKHLLLGGRCQGILLHRTPEQPCPIILMGMAIVVFHSQDHLYDHKRTPGLLLVLMEWEPVTPGLQLCPQHHLGIST